MEEFCSRYAPLVGRKEEEEEKEKETEKNKDRKMGRRGRRGKTRRIRQIWWVGARFLGCMVSSTSFCR